MPTIEERLAALEAKLAALTDTTPTTYYEHQYSGEEIDNAVGRALTGGTLDTSVTNVSNQLGTFTRPNLLDNWYFGNLVNQRGQTSYTGIGYGIDRWKIDIITGSGVSINNGLTIKNAGSYIGQYFDRLFDSLVGIPITGSIILSSGYLLTGTLIYKSIINQPQIFFSDSAGGVSMYVNAISNTLTQVELVSLKDNVSVLAAKLELGPTQTLAHREGDKWVLNEVPEYGEQLRRCQRYCVDITPSLTFNTMYSGFLSTTGCDFLVPIPVTLRESAAAPVVICNPAEWQVAVPAANEYFTPTSINVSQTASGAVMLRCLFSNSLSGQYCDLRKAVDSAKLILSKDL